MKLIKFIVVIIVAIASCVTLNAQVEKHVKNQFNVIASYGEGDTYVLTGELERIINVPKQGDVLYSITDDGKLFGLVVSSVMSRNGKNFTFSVFNPSKDTIKNFRKSYLVIGDNKQLLPYKKNVPPGIVEALNPVYYPEEIETTSKTVSKENTIVKYAGKDFQLGIDTSGVFNVVVDGTVESVQIFGNNTLLQKDGSFIVRIISTDKMIIPNVDVLNAAAVLANGPSMEAPFVFDENSNPQIQLVGFNNNAVVVKISDVSFTNWIFKLNF